MVAPCWGFCLPEPIGPGPPEPPLFFLPIRNLQLRLGQLLKIEPRLGDEVYLQLGNIAYKDRDTDMARLLWRRALELDPQNELVRTSLEGVQE